MELGGLKEARGEQRREGESRRVEIGKTEGEYRSGERRKVARRGDSGEQMSGKRKKVN